MKGSSQDGAIVVGWLTKLALVVAVIGFLGYDGVSIATAHVSASDRANTLASEAADDVRQSHDINKSYLVIRAEAEAEGDTLAPKDFQVSSNGNVTIILGHKANSLWMDHISAFRHFLSIRATGTGAPAS
ncbi:MAG: hypothetical protein JWO22_3375 [Frankiales bacterium]|nr:hypothetical protein [Frankiales bacterium]